VNDTRLGPWRPNGAEERLDRLESLSAIRQLAMRYALAVDSRDLDALADLFHPQVRVGTGTTGRAAIRAWYDEALRGPRTTIHWVVNHIIDFRDADHATGIVYCRDELERPDTGKWQIGTIQYWDTYERVDGEWCFLKRRFHRWYLVDALDRPAHGAGLEQGGDDPLYAHQLPEAFATWAEFWQTPSD
jgi:SnoaL-like domain